MISGRVNIIIPVFNQEQYVAQCMESAFAQTYRNFDVTVVNDGSTDYTRLVIQDTIDKWDATERVKFINLEFPGEPTEEEELTNRALGCRDARDPAALTVLRRRRDPRWLGGPAYMGDLGYWKLNGLFHLIDRENRGLSESRNEGIRAREGEFILPLDSDDWIDPTYLERTVPLMQNPAVGVVSTDMQYEGLRHSRIPPKGLTLQHEMVQNDLPICSLIRRTAFEQTPGYATIFVEAGGSTKVLGYEDWNMWIDILKRGWKVAVVNSPLFHYRIKPVSMITQATQKHKGLVKIIHLLHPDLWPNEGK